MLINVMSYVHMLRLAGGPRPSELGPCILYTAIRVKRPFLTSSAHKVIGEAKGCRAVSSDRGKSLQYSSSQLTLEEFKLGRFESYHHRGCPDGHLQIADGSSRGGQFCGIGEGAPGSRPVFVSESGAVTATIRFYHFYGQQLDENFSFTMRYKFLSNKTAAARYVQGDPYALP